MGKKYHPTQKATISNCYTNPNENQDVMAGLKISIVQHTLGHRDSSLSKGCLINELCSHAICMSNYSVKNN